MINVEVSNIDYAFAMGAKAVALISFKVSHSAGELPLVGEFIVNAVVDRKGDREAMINDAKVALHNMSLELLEHTAHWTS